jgi:vacuolar-type H+-ATPase subunit F/Vma7
MARAAVIGEPLRIFGYGLAGALLCPASSQPEALRGWQALPDDVAVVVLTPQAADWLAAELPSRPEVMPAVLPQASDWPPS